MITYWLRNTSVLTTSASVTTKLVTLPLPPFSNEQDKLFPKPLRHFKSSFKRTGPTGTLNNWFVRFRPLGSLLVKEDHNGFPLSSYTWFLICSSRGH
ncbi:hypothetical protein TNCT_643611 [Trichonephila clavata]|uniref:Uncharacterized protein n=1 Tax=Trichonephila clavata TaxID=2740835 RepID=A0A8X6F322_TRICU|nr:hypothetical protein TNCT_643611 [Trichonephila clavata]